MALKKLQMVTQILVLPRIAKPLQIHDSWPTRGPQKSVMFYKCVPVYHKNQERSVPKGFATLSSKCVFKEQMPGLPLKCITINWLFVCSNFRLSVCLFCLFCLFCYFVILFVCLFVLFCFVVLCFVLFCFVCLFVCLFCFFAVLVFGFWFLVCLLVWFGLFCFVLCCVVLFCVMCLSVNLFDCSPTA